MVRVHYLLPGRLVRGRVLRVFRFVIRSPHVKLRVPVDPVHPALGRGHQDDGEVDPVGSLVGVCAVVAVVHDVEALDASRDGLAALLSVVELRREDVERSACVAETHAAPRVVSEQLLRLDLVKVARSVGEDLVDYPPMAAPASLDRHPAHSTAREQLLVHHAKKRGQREHSAPFQRKAAFAFGEDSLLDVGDDRDDALCPLGDRGDDGGGVGGTAVGEEAGLLGTDLASVWLGVGRLDAEREENGLATDPAPVEAGHCRGRHPESVAAHGHRGLSGEGSRPGDLAAQRPHRLVHEVARPDVSRPEARLSSPNAKAPSLAVLAKAAEAR
mmetsp:Transcript_9733/g.32303  ORF Transcript_9733/g.32303 Transcript_9733/m.32303 type:complete len:329 (+) Transcript_9733:647-1633(+)